ncbi:MAG: hypothetical protein E7305_08700 [Butyrivibrio sp.]|nr:hypothetical protein [Butyrivibrio sp.]
MGIKSITNALLYALKAFFSLLTWFLRSFFQGLKLFFVFLPITSIIFALLFLVSIFVLVTGQNPLPQAIPLSKEPSLTIIPLFESLKQWWISSVYSYKGEASYILLLILTVLMFIPVMSVFLCFSVFAGFGNILFFSVVADAVLYLLGAIIGKSFVHQALSRYFRLFPEAGRRHEEREYDRLLKKRNRMLEEEMRSDHRSSRADDFYGNEDEDYEDEYDPEDEYDEDDYYPKDECAADYDEDYYEDDESDDDDDYDQYDEDYIEDYEDDYDDPRSRQHHSEYSDDRPVASSVGTFDFFAGCNSRESVDKKYRSLVKLYHPDNMDGDTAALQEINVQYEKAKKRWS